MQRSPSSRAFTLIEMITVIAIIAILSGLILGIAGLVQNKGNRARAEADKVALSGACEAYRTDNGGYPQDIPSTGNSVTDSLDPRVNFSPSTSGSPSYASTSLFLYKQLTGDQNANGKIDAGETAVKYASEFFKPSKFNADFKTTGIITYISDPFGYSYGYSTAGLKAEQDYRVQLQTNPNASRTATKGYNPTFDLWSTAGSTANTNVDQAKWIKNW